MVKLFGRADLVDEVRRRMVRSPDDQDDNSVFLIQGEAGAGKSALLVGLAELLKRHVPYAYLDLTRIDAETHGTTIPEVLAAAAFELARPRGRYGTMRFGRLILGHKVMTMTMDHLDRTVAARQISEVLSRQRGLDRHAHALGMFAQQVLAHLPQHPVEVPDAFVDRIAGRVVGHLAKWRPTGRLLLGPYQRWYGDQGRGLGEDAVEELIQLNLWAADADHPANRQSIDELMCSAFLADVQDNYRRKRHAADWSMRCVLLLDNVDTPLGDDLLATLEQVRVAYRDAGVGSPDPLLVIATTRASTAEVTRLRPLTLTQIYTLMSTLPGRAGTDRRLIQSVHEFTGGQPAATDVLLRRVPAGGAAGVALADLLDGDVERQLRDRLLSGVEPDAVRYLVTASAARDRTDGVELAMATHHIAADVITDVAGGLWNQDGTPTVLRRLLLRRLWTQGWYEAFGALRAFRSTDREACLYYMLAEGDIGVVARELAQVAGVSLRRFLDVLDHVTPAPRRPSDDPPDVRVDADEPRSAGALVLDLISELDRSDPVVATVTALVAGLWIAADPLCGNDRYMLYTQIADGYDSLAKLVNDRHGRLNERADEYRSRRRLWANRHAPDSSRKAAHAAESVAV